MDTINKQYILFPKSSPRIKSELLIHKRNQEMNSVNIDNIKKKTLKKYKEIDKIKARIDQGLYPKSIFKHNRDSFMNYQTKSHYENYKKDNLSIANDNAISFLSKITDEEFVDKESKRSLTPIPGITYKLIKEEKKQKDFQHLIEAFGKEQLRHYQELPKFSEHFPEYWKRNQISYRTAKEISIKQDLKEASIENMINNHKSISPIKIDSEGNIHSKYARKTNKEIGALKYEKLEAIQKRNKSNKKKKNQSSISHYLKNFNSNKIIRSAGFSPMNILKE